MKQLLFLLIIVPVYSFSQVKIQNDTLFVDTAKFIVGHDLYIGTGSNVSTKGFNYLFTSPGFSTPVNLSAQWAGYKMKIKKFKTGGNKTIGYKYYLVLDGGAMINYWCDIVPAVENKEVVIRQ